MCPPSIIEKKKMVRALLKHHRSLSQSLCASSARCRGRKGSLLDGRVAWQDAPTGGAVVLVALCPHARLNISLKSFFEPRPSAPGGTSKQTDKHLTEPGGQASKLTRTPHQLLLLTERDPLSLLINRAEGGVRKKFTENHKCLIISLAISRPEHPYFLFSLFFCAV